MDTEQASTQIEFLRQQLQSQERELQNTGRAISQLAQLVEAEKRHTQQLVEKSQLKKAEPEAIAPKEPAPSKAEKVAKMTDSQLLHAMSHPKRIAELLKNL